MLRLAIIGIGWAGERQIQAIRELNRKVSVSCVVDNDPEFLRAKADELAIDKTYTDYHAALNDPHVDAVSICTPHSLHCAMALQAAAAGKHILVEKPIALTVDDATRMIEAAEAADVRLYVAENLSYTPMAHFLRRSVQTGEHIGELVGASLAAGFRAPDFGYPGRRAWLTEPQQGGTGTWMLHGIHTMAQLRYIFGEVESVYMQEHHAASFQRPDIEGTMTGVLTMARGIQITIMQTCEVRFSHNLGGYTIYGDRGAIRANNEGYEVFSYAGDADAMLLRQSYPAATLTEYAQEIEAFADYVAGISEGVTTGKSERRSLAIVQAGYESAKAGVPIRLRERFGEL